MNRPMPLEYPVDWADNRKAPQFSGIDTPLFDFPVVNENPVKKRFPGRFFGDLGMGLLYLLLLACMLLCAAIVVGLVVLGAVGLWHAFEAYGVWTTLITGATLIAYVGCVKLAREERIWNEQRREGE